MFNSKMPTKLLLLSLACLPLTATSAPNESANWFSQSDVTLDTRYQSVLLDNGLRVITVENDTPKKGLSIRMLVDAGSFQETGDEPGLAHFLEHMAFNGSTNVPEGEMVAMLERHGLAFGADTNATTDMTNTNYRLDLPKADTESVNTALFLLRETASELSLDKDAIERERKVILSEVRERQSVWLERFIDQGNYLYKGTDLTQKIGLGTIKGMEEVTQRNLRQFYQTFYAPKNTTLILAGDLPRKVMLERVKHYFSNWTNSEYQPAVDPKFDLVLPTHNEVHVFVDPNIETQIEFNFIEKEQPKARSKETVLDYWTHLIGRRALSKRLDTILYESNGDILSSTMYSSLDYGFARVSKIGLTTADNEGTYGVRILERTLRQAAEFGFTPGEISRQLIALEKDLKLNAETAGDASSSALANHAMNAVDSGYIMLSAQSDLALFEELKGQLTRQAVNEAFNKRWASHPPRIYLTKRRDIDNIHRKVLEAYVRSEAEQVKPYKEQVTTEFAYQNFGQPGKAKLLGTSDYGNIASYRFENGVMLNVKQTDFESGVVYLSVRVGKGKMALTSAQAPLIELYNVGMATGGLKAHDINELGRIFSGTTMGLQSHVTTNAFVTQQAVVQEDVLNQLRVFTALMTEGGYREEGKSFALQSVKQYLETYQESPEQVRDFHIGQKLRGGDLRWAPPTVDALKKVSMSDLKPIVESAVAKGPIEIGVVGDISNQQAIDYVAQTFGALDIKLNDTLDRYQIAFPQIKKENVTWYHEGDKTTALASSYWNLPDARNTAQALDFLLLEHVIQQRVTKQIREATGAAYSPWVGRQQSYNFKDFGYLVMNSNTTLDQVDSVFEAYKNVLRSLQTTPITDDELTRAVTPLVDAVAQQVESNGYWFDLVSTAQTYPDMIEADGMTGEKLAAVTKEDILAAARLIDIDTVLEVKVLPQK